MAHVAKFTRGTCGLLARHYDRYKDKEHPEEVKYKNQDIDSSRTYLNYNLAPMREQMPYLKKRLKEVHCLNRDDVNVMCDWVVTAPKELPEEHQREFFEVVYKHLEEKYGEKNVISAYVHMDENQPHMHFAFIPVVYDIKKGKEKVSAKEALNRTQLKKFHPELQQVVNNWIYEKDYDFSCEVLNGATEGGNRTVEELKLETIIALQEEEQSILSELFHRENEAYAEISKLEARAEKSQELKNENELLEKENSSLRSEASELSAQISEADLQLKEVKDDYSYTRGLLQRTQKALNAQEAYLGILSSADVEKIENRARENTLGKLKGKDEVIIDRTDYESLVRTAKLVDGIREKLDKISSAYEYTKEAANKIISDAKSKAREILDEAGVSVMQWNMKKAEKEIKFERYEILEKNYPDVFKQMRMDMAEKSKKRSRMKIRENSYDDFER